MADNRKYYSSQLARAKEDLNSLDFMIVKIAEAQLLVKHGVMAQAELDELESKYLTAIQNKNALRDKVRAIETALQAEIEKHDAEIKAGAKTPEQKGG